MPAFNFSMVNHGIHFSYRLLLSMNSLQSMGSCGSCAISSQYTKSFTVEKKNGGTLDACCGRS